MENVKFSVVVTILNEEKSIGDLLTALINQSDKPLEIIVVDAGSHDATVEIVKASGVTLIEASGANRSAGRNIGIKASISDYIAVTDAGCIPHPHWLEQLAKGFEVQEVSTVAGYYSSVISNNWQKIFSWYLAVQPEDFDETTFLPSSRSLAFTKKAWQIAGKYPENLNTCEDLVFAKKLKETGMMVVNRKAMVEWILPSTAKAFITLIASYARGDIEALYQPHLVKHLFVWFRYIIFCIFPYLFVIYMAYPIFKFRKRFEYKLLFKILVTQLFADVGVMWGGLSWLFRHISNTY
jgi:glycosyltransferase involved in cell wall biosynthesis